MLSALLIFLVGVLVLVVVIYVAKLVLDMLVLPPPVRQIAFLIIGLVALICLVILMVNVLGGGGIGWNIN